MGNGFATQTDYNYAIYIGVKCKAGQDFLAHSRIGCNITAACIKDDIYGSSYLGSHNAAGFAATGTGRENQNMVADAGTTFFSSVAIKLHVIYHPFPICIRWHNLWGRCGYFHG